MKKFGIGMFFAVLCLAVAFLFPHSGGTWENVDDGGKGDGCLDCHGNDKDPEGPLHDLHDGQECDICHAESEDTPATSACIVCHPMSDPGECPLVELVDHNPAKGSPDCQGCHDTCAEETTTTTTTEEETTTTTTTEEETTTTTTTEEETTTTTTSIGDASITAAPLSGDFLRRSRLLPLPEFLIIRGEGTDFAYQTDVVYSPDGQVLSIFPLALTPTLILNPIIVLPARSDEGESEDATLTVTVDGLSDDVEIRVLPISRDEE